MTDMSKEELSNEYFNLKNQNQTLLSKIEEYKQELYETKRELTTSKLMQEELSAELEAVQNTYQTESNKLSTTKIAALEEDIERLKKNYSENLEQLEQELVKKDAEIQTLQTKIPDVSASLDKSKDETIEKLSDELCELKSKNELLLYHLEEEQNKCKILGKENNSLENKINVSTQNIIRNVNINTLMLPGFF